MGGELKKRYLTMKRVARGVMLAIAIGIFALFLPAYRKQKKREEWADLSRGL